MAIITEAESLAIVSLVTMKSELRIPLDSHDHDALLSQQIHAAAGFVMASTGVGIADLPRTAVVAVVRAQYDGGLEVSPKAAHYIWMAPFRSYKVAE